MDAPARRQRRSVTKHFSQVLYRTRTTARQKCLLCLIRSLLLLLLHKMQRLASQSLHSRLTFQASFLGMLRSLACCQTQALHTTTAQCKKQTTEEDELPAADGAISDVGASSSSDSDADSLSDSEASTADAQSAEAAAAAAVEAAGASAENQAYRGLDHKDFNITLK